MKIVITVPQINQGGGLSKYIVTLSDILTRDGVSNEVWVVTTHASTVNNEFEALRSCRNLHYVGLHGHGRTRMYLSLVRLIRRIAPDVVICNYNAPTQYVLPLLPRRTRIVHILHNDTDDFYRVGSINGAHVDGWIAPTPAVVERFNRYTGGRYSDRVMAIPHGVELPTHEPGHAADEPVNLVFTGVLYEHKGMKILPDVIKRLRAAGHRFTFTFIGDGILHRELSQRLADEVADGTVTFTGRIPGPEVYRRLAAADIFVYPTHLDSFGLVIAEAMINRAVPVVTRLPGITDTIVKDGRSGYLLERDDVDGYVDRIGTLISRPDRLAAMADEAGRRALSMFSADVMRRNYTEYLENLTK